MKTKLMLVTVLSLLFAFSGCGDDEGSNTFSQSSVDYDLDGLNKIESDDLIFYSSYDFEVVSHINLFIGENIDFSLSYDDYKTLNQLGFRVKIEDLDTYYQSIVEEMDGVEIDTSIVEGEVLPTFDYSIEKTAIEVRGVKGYKVVMVNSISNYGELDDVDKEKYIEEVITTSYIYATDDGIILVYTDDEDALNEIMETIYFK